MLRKVLYITRKYSVVPMWKGMVSYSSGIEHYTHTQTHTKGIRAIYNSTYTNS